MKKLIKKLIKIRYMLYLKAGKTTQTRGMHEKIDDQTS